jgi:sugar (pentulose or hexulose) kinase
MTGAAPLIAVIDHGKTNVRVMLADERGRIVASEATPNRVLAAAPRGPAWRHHDLAGLSDWAFARLARMAAGRDVGAVVPTGHGSGGVLVAQDPDADGSGAALPMPDYEEAYPPALDAAFAALGGSFADRGSAIMHGSTHQARQLYRMQAEAPDAVAGAAAYLSVPQWWAWRLSGVAVSEYSTLGAQSLFWNVGAGRWSALVGRLGWGRLLPPPVPSWTRLGPVRPALVARYGLPAGMQVLAGGHDSTLNLYRYVAMGHGGITLVSTGTWIVALSDVADPARLDPARGMTLNASPEGRPVGGALTMGGRSFEAIAGAEVALPAADPEIVARLVARGTMALPSFTEDAGQFAGSGGRGRVTGPAPGAPGEARALAALHVALLAAETALALGDAGPVVLDGAFLSDPAFAPLVAAILHGRRVLASRETAGTAAGAALLAGHTARKAAGSDVGADVVDLLDPVAPIALPGLSDYAARWRAAALA